MNGFDGNMQMVFHLLEIVVIHIDMERIHGRIVIFYVNTGY